MDTYQNLQLNDTPSGKNYGWTEEQTDFLKAQYPTMSYPKIALAIGKKPSAVSVYAMRLGLEKPESNHNGRFKRSKEFNDDIKSTSNNKLKIIWEDEFKVTVIKRGKVINLEKYRGVLGKTKRGNKYIVSIPRTWTEEEKGWIWEKHTKENYNNAELSYLLGRTKESISRELIRLSKTHNVYNEKYRLKKWEENKKFFDLINSENEVVSIADAYAGERRYWDDYSPKVNVVTNDIDLKFNTNYNKKAHDFLLDMERMGESFDIVDLDPYGSPNGSLKLGLKLANRGFIVTLGEMGNIKYKRLDFVKKMYGIKTFKDFTVGNLEKRIVEWGRDYGKELKCTERLKLGRFSYRLYFRVEPVK